VGGIAGVVDAGATCGADGVVVTACGTAEVMGAAWGTTEVDEAGDEGAAQGLAV
jgi:hypothetical protein